VECLRVWVAMGELVSKDQIRNSIGKTKGREKEGFLGERENESGTRLRLEFPAYISLVRVPRVLHGQSLGS
jgi:hypothetical protein